MQNGKMINTEVNFLIHCLHDMSIKLNNTKRWKKALVFLQPSL